MRWVVLFVCTLLLGATGLAAEIKLVTIEGYIVNHKGQPFTNVTVHAFGPVYRSTKSDAEGKWRFEVSPGDWVIRVDPDELVVRGYACFPDWNQPVLEEIKEIKFEVIPTRPIFSAPKIAEGEVEHTITFETTLRKIENVRTYKVQKSVDRSDWQDVKEISLVDSPIVLKDPQVPGQIVVYRAVLLEDVQPEQ